MLPEFISEAEKKYLTILEERCRSLFSAVHIPSHDHLHHARVWVYAKEILKELENAGMITDPFIADKVMIAAWFHDTGLTINTGPDHGSQSRDICKEFLETNHIPEEYHNEILEAVEKHDDKSYASDSEPSSAAAIVSVADDIDAFGHIGILRYSEIYSMRNIPFNEMADMVIANAESRFIHLESTYKMFPELISEQAERLETLVSFYRSLKAEMPWTL